MQTQIIAEKDSFLYKALRKLYIFAQIFGSASFSYSPEIGVHLTPINIFCFVLAFVFNCSLTYINATTELKIDAEGDQNLLFYLGMRGYPIALPLMVWSPSCTLFWHRKKIANLMEEMLALDSELNQIHKTASHINFLRRYQTVFCIFCVSASISVSFLCYYTNVYVDGGFIAKYSLYLTNIFMLANHLFYSSLTVIFYVAFQIQFSSLNEFFSSIFVPSANMIASQRLSSMDQQRLVSKLAKIHDKLCQLFFRTNQYAAIVLLFSPLQLLILTLLTLDTLFVGLYENNFNITLEALVYVYTSLHMCIVAVIKIDAVVRSGSKGRFTGVLVHQAIWNTKDSALLQKLELFSMQILHSNPRCNLSILEFDWEIGYSFVTATLSYSLTIIQYQFLSYSGNKETK